MYLLGIAKCQCSDSVYWLLPICKTTMNIQKMCFRKGEKKEKRGELTLINIRCGKNES